MKPFLYAEKDIKITLDFLIKWDDSRIEWIFRNNYVESTLSILTLWKSRQKHVRSLFLREINYIVNHLVNPLLSRNFCQKSVRANLRMYIQCLTSSRANFTKEKFI